MEEEINLRELIEVLLQGKWIIAGISFVAVLLAGILSFGVMDEEFEARAVIMFDKKFIDQQGLSLDSYKELVTAHSRVEGVFTKLELGSRGYKLVSFKKSIKTDINKDASLISITVSNNDPELAQKVANELGVGSVNDFRRRLIDDKDREIEKAVKMLAEVETELEKTPRLLGTFEVQASSTQVIQVPQVNPLYDRLATRWDEVNANVTTLRAEKEYLDEGLKSGGKGLYIMLQQAHLPETPVSPRKTLNMAVAGVLGFMVSVFVVFFMEFWRKSATSSRSGNAAQ